MSAAHHWNGRHFAALIGANVALALGPWAMRLADTGPVAAGFWRLTLALPALFAFAACNRQPLTGMSRRAVLAVVGAGVFFAGDLATWHIGTGMTRLGNVTLFGNSSSLLLMIWGALIARRAPSRREALAICGAAAGGAILFSRSLEIGTATLIGDLFCLMAGFFYTFYLLLLQGARARLGNWALLAWSSVVGAPVLLMISTMLGETIWPQNWWPLIALSLGSQVIGQGLLVYSLRHFSPLIIGMALLTQPAIAALVGRFVFDERLGAWDVLGMALVGVALVIARARARPDKAADAAG